jgi:hypothetical protein
VGLFNFFKRRKSSGSAAFKNSPECKRLLTHIDAHNQTLALAREEYFTGDGKPYHYYFDNNTMRAAGYYFWLGYDQTDAIVAEKFQGRNIATTKTGW